MLAQAAPTACCQCGMVVKLVCTNGLLESATAILGDKHMFYSHLLLDSFMSFHASQQLMLHVDIDCMLEPRSNIGNILQFVY